MRTDSPSCFPRDLRTAGPSQEDWTPAHAAGIDDIAFVRSLLEAIGPRYHLDTSRAVVTGISNGGHLAHALGCVLADHLAGIVPVAAPLPIGSASKCKPSRPLSVLEIVGSIDQDASTFPDTLAFWARTDQCPSHLVSSSLPDEPNNGTSVTIAGFAGCRGGTEVTGYLINGGGLAWPGGKPLGSVEDFGTATQQFDASELIWTFLSRHV